MYKLIKHYKVGDYVFWKSHEGIKEKGFGIVIDLYQAPGGYSVITARNSGKTVSLLQADIYNK